MKHKKTKLDKKTEDLLKRMVLHGVINYLDLDLSEYEIIFKKRRVIKNEI